MLFWLILLLSLPVWLVPKRYAWVTGGVVCIAMVIIGASTKTQSCTGDGCIANSILADFFLYVPAAFNALVGIVRSLLATAGNTAADAEDVSD